MDGLPKYPADLWARTDEELVGLGLFREPGRGQIRDKSGLRVCAFEGRSHRFYLYPWTIKVHGGYQLVWIDKESFQRVKPRRSQMQEIISDLAARIIQQEVEKL